jgi:hypothetical protein
VDRFFKDDGLDSAMKFASFNSAKAWKQKIHDIPYGIAEDAWNISSITVKSGMIDLEPTTYSF